jgi:hypothetical protein
MGAHMMSTTTPDMAGRRHGWPRLFGWLKCSLVLQECCLTVEVMWSSTVSPSAVRQGWTRSGH